MPNCSATCSPASSGELLTATFLRSGVVNNVSIFGFFAANLVKMLSCRLFLLFRHDFLLKR
jgi:hypothetical protein